MRINKNKYCLSAHRTSAPASSCLPVSRSPGLPLSTPSSNIHFPRFFSMIPKISTSPAPPFPLPGSIEAQRLPCAILHTRSSICHTPRRHRLRPSHSSPPPHFLPVPTAKCLLPTAKCPFPLSHAAPILS